MQLRKKMTTHYTHTWICAVCTDRRFPFSPWFICSFKSRAIIISTDSAHFRWSQYGLYKTEQESLGSSCGAKAALSYPFFPQNCQSIGLRVTTSHQEACRYFCAVKLLADSRRNHFLSVPLGHLSPDWEVVKYKISHRVIRYYMTW